MSRRYQNVAASGAAGAASVRPIAAPYLRVFGGGHVATYSLDFLTASDPLTAYQSSRLATAVADGTAFGGAASATNPVLESTAGFTGDQFNQSLIFGVPASRWGQVAAAQLALTTAALNTQPLTSYEIDNIPTVYARIGDTASAVGMPGAVELTVDNVQNLLLDATGSPYGALDTIYTATLPGQRGVIAIASGAAGGFFSINPVGYGTPDVPAPAGLRTDGSGQTLLYVGGGGDDSLLIGHFAGSALIALGGNDGAVATQLLPVSLSGPTPFIPPDAGPPTDSSQLDNTWRAGQALLGDLSIVGIYAAGTSAAQTTTIAGDVGVTGRVGVFASPIDTSGVAAISGLGVSDPNATPTSNTGGSTDIGLGGGYGVDGQTGHDELDFNWSAATQVGGATVTLDSTSPAALQAARLGVELFDNGQEVYSGVLSPGAIMLAGPGPQSGTYVAPITLGNLTDSHGKPLTWNAMHFIGEPAAPGSASVLLDTLTLNDVALLFIQGGDTADLGNGVATVDYRVGRDGVQSINGFVPGRDRLVLDKTSVGDVTATQYGDRTVLSFASAPGGAVVLDGVTGITLAQHLHASGGNVVFR